MWANNAIFMRGWLRALEPWLESQDDDYASWWTHGYIMNKNQLVAPTEYHTVMLRDKRVKAFTFEKPIPATVFDDRRLGGITPLTRSEL